ncbi:hypothetical protein TrLO_g781 [Triparma laevis f. longispina]|uniref:Uncharacterized protein n=1 Tax=Triparma laevis f. longispina TaxID=1714387 RepID=A0A9W7C4N4_9STRA|nr:hypothetical protein TrLO_g781 [Triparma laevis f. longispina]
MRSCPLAPVRCKYCRSSSRKPLRRFQYYSHLQSKHNAEVIIDGIFTPSTPVRFSPVQKCTLKGLHDKEFNKEVLERIEELEVLERIILDPKTASSETKIFFDKANIIKEQGYYKKAVRYFMLSKQGLKLGLDADGSTTDTYFASMGNLANTYIDMKDYEAGKECYLEILTMHEKLYGPDHKNTLLACNNLGTCYKIKEDFQKALELHTRAYKSRLKCLGRIAQGHPHKRKQYWKYYDVRFGSSEFDNAYKYYNIAREGREKSFGVNDEKTFQSWLNIAHIKGRFGELDEAIDISRKTLTKYEKKFGTDHGSSRMCAQRFVKACLMKGRENLTREEVSEMKLAMMKYSVSGDEGVTRETNAICN